MYKDKGKQKEANKEAMRRSRVAHKGIKGQGITEGSTELGFTIESMKPSERDLWDKHGFDCRTPVYLECLGR